MPDEKIYIGDGVYATYLERNRYILLSTNRGLTPEDGDDDEIYLDGDCIRNLLDFMKRKRLLENVGIRVFL